MTQACCSWKFTPPVDIFIVYMATTLMRALPCNLLQSAKKMGGGLHERFVIFVREQEHRQNTALATTVDVTTDLVSYVEFQRNYK